MIVAPVEPIGAPPERSPIPVRQIPERVVVFRLRTLLAGLGVVLGLLALISFVVLARSALTLIAVALFLAVALNPAVEFFRRRGLRRGVAIGAVYAIAVLAAALLGLVFAPPLIDQTTQLVHNLPGLVADLTKGHGPFGFLERKYHVVEQARKVTSGSNGASDLAGAAAPALSIAKGVATTIFGVVIIAFLTLFMLLEGPAWRTRLVALIPPTRRPRTERICSGVYRAVGGFVAGNLLASLLAGLVATFVLLFAGVPYAFPLGLFAAIVELVPYLGPLVVTIVLGLVAATQGMLTAAIVVGLMLVYHIIEGHTLRPLIYGRALKLSALSVLISILIGTEVAGVLGALAAIPVAGAVQVIVAELRAAPIAEPASPAGRPSRSIPT